MLTPHPQANLQFSHVAQHLRAFHNQHLQQICSALSPVKRQFLDALPLLLHYTHPNLPGYQRRSEPHGILGFEPSPQRVRQILGPFTYNPIAPEFNRPLLAVYLMGSATSPLAYGTTSDFDIWVCCTDLPQEQYCELERKTQAIMHAAGENGIEVHIYLVEPGAFRKGMNLPVSRDSCGQLQHHLLLEEFYRSALLIAGALPVWWLVPPEREDQYEVIAANFLQNRYPDTGPVIDLGALSGLKTDEFIAGTLWHLNKAIDSPEKSLLKLLLTECYAEEYPHPQWLCHLRKVALYKWFYQPEKNLIHELDPYHLMYKKIERHLVRHQALHRLELARFCFYLKLLHAARPHWRREHPLRDYLQQIQDEWGWSMAQIKHLESVWTWQLSDWMVKLLPLQQELLQTYDHISCYIEPLQNRVSRTETMLVLRRLRALLHQEPGKVDRIYWNYWAKHDHQNTRIKLLPYPNFSWQLQIVEGKRQTELFQNNAALLHLLSWLVINGFWSTASSPYQLQMPEDHGLCWQIHRILRRLSACWNNAVSESHYHAYKSPPQDRIRILLVQAKSDRPLPGDRQRISDCLLSCVESGQTSMENIGHCELLTINSWEEATIRTCFGGKAMLQLLYTSDRTQPFTPVEVIGYGNTYLPALEQSTHRLIHQTSTREDTR